MTRPEASRATLYVEPEEFDAGSAEVTGDAYRHLFRARRLATGDPLRVVDGRGRARAATVAEVGPRAARIELGATEGSRAAARRICLIVAPPRPERASWLVEKATELGVERLAWLACERAARGVSKAALARHGRVAIAALEQCGGANLPTITGPHLWSELPGLVAGLDAWWILDPAGSRLAAPVPSKGALGLVIGPEGGWSEGERGVLEALGGGSWSLGERVLRVETAAVVGAALLLSPSPNPAVTATLADPRRPC